MSLAMSLSLCLPSQPIEFGCFSLAIVLGVLLNVSCLLLLIPSLSSVPYPASVIGIAADDALPRCVVSLRHFFWLRDSFSYYAFVYVSLLMFDSWSVPEWGVWFVCHNAPPFVSSDVMFTTFVG